MTTQATQVDVATTVETDMVTTRTPADAAPPAADPPTPPAEAAPPPADAGKAARKEKLSEIQKLAEAQRVRYEEARRLREERGRYENEGAQLRAQLEEAQKRLDAAEKDPLGYLESRGIKTEDVADRLVKKGMPEEQVAKLADQVKALEAQVTEERRVWQEREARARKAQAFEKAKNALVTSFEDGKDTYKNLHTFVAKQAERTGASASDVLVDEFMAQVNRIRTNPQTAPYAAEYSDTEILASIDKRYDGLFAAPALAPTAKDAKPPIAPKAAPKTLTNAQASESSPIPELPENWDSLTDRQQNKWLAEQLRAGKYSKSP